MRLETERMVIRDFLPDDAADLQEIFGDAETMKNFWTPSRRIPSFFIRPVDFTPSMASAKILWAFRWAKPYSMTARQDS